ncbi:MAG TPA: hypothetical protein VNA25_12665 [Phycisphaerae bacterium]|nr:hypothetical protein [Phycisphaerae bacterium]
MTEHTALPWHLDTRWGRLVVQGPRGEDIANVFGTRTEEGKGCAAFIVRAVNAHDGLVAALETVEWLEWIPRDGLGAAFCPFCHAWKIEGHAPDCHLAAALAKAKQ